MNDQKTAELIKQIATGDIVEFTAAYMGETTCACCGNDTEFTIEQGKFYAVGTVRRWETPVSFQVFYKHQWVDIFLEGWEPAQIELHKTQKQPSYELVELNLDEFFDNLA